MQEGEGKKITIDLFMVNGNFSYSKNYVNTPTNKGMNDQR